MSTKSVINLLPESAVEGSRRISLFKTLQAILITAVMACLILAIGIWALSLVAGRQVAAENLKLRTLEEKIKSYSKKEQQFYLLTRQLDKGNEILNSRSQIQKKLNNAILAFPPEAVLLSAKIEAPGKWFSVKFSADNFDNMVKVVATAKTNPFSLVKVNEFSRNTSGQYEIDLTVELL